MTHGPERTRRVIDELRARARDLSEELEGNPDRRGTAWYDDRVRELHCLRRSAAERETRLYQSAG